jgi:hypothetical protein
MAERDSKLKFFLYVFAIATIIFSQGCLPYLNLQSPHS